MVVFCENHEKRKRERGNEIQGRKRRSPFSTLSEDKQAIPAVPAVEYKKFVLACHLFLAFDTWFSCQR
jgi:hypothetical protein